MRGLFAILLVGMLVLPASASEGGVNKAASLDGTGIKSLIYEDVLRAKLGSNFEISLEIEDGANISEVSWVTQSLRQFWSMLPSRREADGKERQRRKLWIFT